MKVSRKIKDNRFIRGIWASWLRNFGGMKRGRFGYIADSVILTPPCLGIWITYISMKMLGLDLMPTCQHQMRK